MSFFSKAFRAPKKDGQELLTELIDHACSNADAIRSYSDIVYALAVRHEALIPEAQRKQLASCYAIFVEDALEFGKAATEALGLLTDRKVDVSGMHEVEFLVLVNAVDALLLAKWIAEEIAVAPDQVASVESLEFNPDDPRRLKKNDIISFGDFARDFRGMKGFRLADYTTQYLPTVRSRLPDTIIRRGERLWDQLKT